MPLILTSGVFYSDENNSHGLKSMGHLPAVFMYLRGKSENMFARVCVCVK